MLLCFIYFTTFWSQTLEVLFLWWIRVYLLTFWMLIFFICLLNHLTYDAFVFQISSFTGFWSGGLVANSMQSYWRDCSWARSISLRYHSLGWLNLWRKRYICWYLSWIINIFLFDPKCFHISLKNYFSAFEPRQQTDKCLFFTYWLHAFDISIHKFTEVLIPYCNENTNLRDFVFHWFHHRLMAFYVVKTFFL